MGDRIVEVLIKAKDTTATAIGRFRRRMRAVRRVVRDVTRTVVASTAAIGAMALGLTKLGERGDKVNAVKRTFAKITGDETAALQGLRAAAQGTINDFDLMAKANQAMTIGAAKSVEEFAEMVRLSRALGRAQGLDATKALEVFTLALARQSAQRADDLGLQLKGIEASKFQAEFMRQAREKVEEYTAATEPGTAATVRFQTAIANLRDQLATFVAESPEVAKAFDFVTGIVEDVATAVSSGRFDLIVDAFKALGGLAGNAFGAAFFEGAAAVFDKIDRALIPKSLEEKIMTPLGLLAQAMEGAADSSAEAAKAWREALGAAARAAAAAAGAAGGGGGAGVGGGGGGGGALTVPGGITGPALPGSPFSADALEAFRMRRDRVRMMPAGLAQMAGLNPTPLAGLSDEQRAAIDAKNAADTIKKGADGFDEAAQIAAASLFSIGEAAIRGSSQVEASIINMITNILRSIPDVGGGLSGVIIGGVGGILSAAFGGRRRDPVPVRMADVDRKAADKLKQAGGDPQNITVVIEQGGVEIERIEYLLAERSRRDATVRYGRKGRLTTRGSG